MDHDDLRRAGRPGAVARLRRVGRRGMAILWHGLGELGLAAHWPFGIQMDLSELYPPSAALGDDRLDSPPTRHPERLVPYEFLSSDERRLWTDFEARVR